MKWIPPGSKTGQDANLVTLFTHFMAGDSPVNSLTDLSILPAPSKDDHSKFPVLGSSLDPREKLPLSPNILFDEIHSHWFRVLLEAIVYKFATACSSDLSAKPPVVVIDNSPGFTGIAPALHEWLTDFLPREEGSSSPFAPPMFKTCRPAPRPSFTLKRTAR